MRLFRLELFINREQISLDVAVCGLTKVRIAD